jgi:hypothetical protein
MQLKPVAFVFLALVIGASTAPTPIPSVPSTPYATLGGATGGDLDIYSPDAGHRQKREEVRGLELLSSVAEQKSRHNGDDVKARVHGRMAPRRWHYIMLYRLTE